MTEHGSGVVPRINGKAVVKDPPLVARIDRLMLAVVIVQFVLAGLHGVAHLGGSVASDIGQLVYASAVIVMSLYGSYRHYRHPGRAGAVLLVISMAGAFIFGAYFHFLADTEDNIRHVHSATAGSWAMPFDLTAVLLAILELFGTALAYAVLRRRVRIS
ncbi:hypothetical protein AB0C38_10580 [Amycolatopsis sp. NPDC048633]|uniref:hypothetical protein n=1 Tax=Amycolatopsis sp. NPDC048633 TaxID=3157095 RepID=UPI0034086792